MPGYIIGASDWLGEIWDAKAAFVNKPVLLLWGFKDIAFRKKEFDLWLHHLTKVETHEFPDCGHLIAEEAPEIVIELLEKFIAKQSA